MCSSAVVGEAVAVGEVLALSVGAAALPLGEVAGSETPETAADVVEDCAPLAGVVSEGLLDVGVVRG